MHEVTGWKTTEEERIKEEAKRQTPELVKEEFKKNSRELFYLWEYLYSKGLLEEAREYIDNQGVLNYLWYNQAYIDFSREYILTDITLF